MLLRKSTISKCTVFVALILFLAALTGCPGIDPGADLDPVVDGVTSVSVSPSKATIVLDIDRTHQFTATVSGTGTFEETVTWTITGNSDAETTISDTGLLTVSEGEALGTITVTAASTEDASKSGTAAVTVIDPIVITSAEDFKKIGVADAYPLDGNYMLTTGITLSMDENWSGIASGQDEVFSGTFDGNGNTITLTSLAVSGNTRDGYLLAGLFAGIGGTADDKASVKNLNVAADITMAAPASNLSAGIIAGYAQDADFENITVTGNAAINTTANKLYLGGIVGGFYDNTVIKNCHNAGDINGAATTGGSVYSGGIAGYGASGNSPGVSGSSIEDCSSSGKISAIGGIDYAGGITGAIESIDANVSTSIVRSHASGDISVDKGGGDDYVGGIAGNNKSGLLSQCYFTDGTVTGNEFVGGIAGYVQTSVSDAVIEDCWSGGTVTGRVNSGGIVGQNGPSVIIQRCYSITTVSASLINTSGMGGIVGKNNGTPTVKDCAALNSALKPMTTSRVGRVIGIGVGSNNYAWKDMPVKNGQVKPKPGSTTLDDGADCDAKPLQSFYVDTLGWDFDTVWKMEGDYPALQWQD